MTGEEFKRIVDRFNADCTQPNGLVFVGHAESVAAAFAEVINVATHQKQELTEEEVIRILQATWAEILPATSDLFQTRIGQFNRVVAERLQNELLFLAHVSGGFSTERPCRRCNGPMEDRPEDRIICEKCRLTLEKVNLELQIETQLSLLDQAQAQQRAHEHKIEDLTRKHDGLLQELLVADRERHEQRRQIQILAEEKRRAVELLNQATGTNHDPR